MKSIIIFTIFLSVASAAYNNQYGQQKSRPHYQSPHTPQQQQYHQQPKYNSFASQSYKPVASGAHNDVPILRQDSDVQPDGQYRFSYETGNGIQVSESGVAGQQVQGSAAWTAPDGTPVQLSYVADENGYQPTGSHIPTPPPIPEAIARALEYIRTHPYQEEQHQQQHHHQPQQQQYRASAPAAKVSSYQGSNYNRNTFGQQKKVYG